MFFMQKHGSFLYVNNCWKYQNCIFAVFYTPKSLFSLHFSF